MQCYPQFAIQQETYLAYTDVLNNKSYFKFMQIYCRFSDSVYAPKFSLKLVHYVISTAFWTVVLAFLLFVFFYSIAQVAKGLYVFFTVLNIQSSYVTESSISTILSWYLSTRPSATYSRFIVREDMSNSKMHTIWKLDLTYTIFLQTRIESLIAKPFSTLKVSTATIIFDSFLNTSRNYIEATLPHFGVPQSHCEYWCFQS